MSLSGTWEPRRVDNPRRFALLIFLFLLALLPERSFAWDRHVHISRRTLEGLELKNPKLWQQLQNRVLVTPIEQFLKKAFGDHCTYDKARESVFESVGERFNVMYVEGATYSHNMNWHNGTNKQVFWGFPEVHEPNAQAVGEFVTPIEVMSVYSDEPDWGMDDDVPALRGKGSATKDVEGSGTRLLRHFWYKGQVFAGFDWGKDQETDKRMQLFYELAMIAFRVDEPYWGYRFLGNSLHYLQDMTQPFHVEAVISHSMVDELAIMHGALCDAYRRSKRGAPPDACRPQDTLANAKILNGWIVGGYHALFEDFVMGLIVENTFGTAQWVIDAGNTAKENFGIEELVVKYRPDGLLALEGMIYDSQAVMFPSAGLTGDLVWRTFGRNYKLRPKEMVTAHLSVAGTPGSRAYQMARHMYGIDDEAIAMTPAQREAFKKLIENSHGLMARAGAWGRSFVTSTLRSANEVMRAQSLPAALMTRTCK